MQQTEEKRITAREGVRAIARHLNPYKREIVVLSAFGVIVAIADGLVPYVTGRFFDALIGLSQGEPQAELPVWFVLLLAWVLVQLVANNASWVLDRRQRRVRTAVHVGLQAEGFAKFFHLPIAFHKNELMSQEIERVNKASWQIPAIIRVMYSFFPQLLSVFIGLLLVLTIHPPMALVLGTGVAAYILLLVWIVRPVAALDEKAQRKWNDSWGDAHAAVQQIESVKHAAADDYESDKIHRQLSGETFSLWYRLEKIWSNVGAFQRIIVFLTQLGIFVYSVHLIADGTISVGDLVALNGYAAMFFGPFVAMGFNWEVLQNGLTSAVLADNVFLAKEEVYEPKNAVALSEVSGAVEFRNVSFRYTPEQEDTLREVSFSVAPGSTVALVGESGVGKSTTIGLISGYYFPTSGGVFIDDADTRTLKLLPLRQRIAVVPQEVALFNDTIGNNIRYGSFDANEETVRKAAARAHIDEFIESLPQGYETVVGERGMKLSVGQKQRVAIARAVLRDPAILILDEPTSALDAKTEQLITESLEGLMKGRTTFIIAHRLSTVRKADTILVFEKGQIVEQGTHDELMHKKDGVYRKLYEYQIGLHE